ncbi:hypothetical protein T552_01817 [Pneumocystis carinii B80]|uniref:F-box domain-containing protein n=1 Tax=Pneumocystis carinii (strain B80) TaxID=1408658 RepID=A0A0W4ZJJ2_PNEC8|nr:hypothetical protein T552_01817 [Pneumocystis carinii B80]KTW28556.1 hypothetical protein T552_01817 [Pneumocystis carinii B80]
MSHFLNIISHPDLIEMIAEYMHFIDLVSLSCVCKIARYVIYDNYRCWRMIDLSYTKGNMHERYQNAKETHLATFKTIQLLFKRSNIPLKYLTVIILDFSAVQYPAVRFIMLQAGLSRLKKISLRHCRFISLKDLNSILMTLQRVWTGETNYYKQSSSSAITPYVLKELRVRYMKGLPKYAKDLYYNYSQYNLLYIFREIAKLLRFETDVETCSMNYPNDLLHNRQICIDYWDDHERIDYNIYYSTENLFFDLNKAYRKCDIHPEIANYKFCRVCLQNSQCSKCGESVCPLCQGVDQCNLFYLNIQEQDSNKHVPLKVGFCQQCGILCKNCRNNDIFNCLICLVPYCAIHMSSNIKYCCEIGGEGVCNKCTFKKPWLQQCFGGCRRIICKKEVAGKCFKCHENICWQCIKLSMPLESSFMKSSFTDHFSTSLGFHNTLEDTSAVIFRERILKTICISCKLLVHMRKRKLESQKISMIYGLKTKRFTKHMDRRNLALKLYQYSIKPIKFWTKKSLTFHPNQNNLNKIQLSSIEYNNMDFTHFSRIPSHYLKFINTIRLAINNELANGINKKDLANLIIEITNNILTN